MIKFKINSFTAKLQLLNYMFSSIFSKTKAVYEISVNKVAGALHTT